MRGGVKAAENKTSPVWTFTSLSRQSQALCSAEGTGETGRE